MHCSCCLRKTDSKEQDVKKLLRVHKNKSENLFFSDHEGHRS